MYRSLLLGSLVFAWGCSGQTLYPVSGKLTAKNGQPVDAEVLVEFVPDAEKGNLSKVNSSAIVSNGSFTLQTNLRRGAPAGWYKVMIDYGQNVTAADKAKFPIPADIRNWRKTPIAVEVVSSPAVGAYDFSLVR
jgi:predicted flavoprotein YhiN